MRELLRIVFFFFFGLLIPPSLLAQSLAGHTSWGPWSFDWEVVGKRGVGLRNVMHNGRLFIYKANLPVVRVKYVSEFLWFCGPYQDRIKESNLVATTCSASKICQRSFVSGGANWLELGGYAKIGAYDIYQAWYFSDRGQISARLFSKGLHCQRDHDHHPYWRFDIDADGAANDQITIVQTGGNGLYLNEQNDTKFPPGFRRWFIRDQPTGRGMWIIPGSGDGFADGFSSKDAAPRLFKSSEDEDWPFGAWGHLGYQNFENINQRDVVFWYVAHMKHLASQGGNVWHVAGPNLAVQP